MTSRGDAAHGRGAGRLKRRAAASLVVAAMGTLVCQASAAGQTVDLGSLEQLARDGRSEEARRGMDSWWEESGDTASPEELEWALWLRGRLAADPAEAAADYHRLLDQYSAGPYADLALLRLAQMALLRGDSVRARAHYAALAADYPGRQSGAAARLWLEVNALAEVAEAALPMEPVTQEEAPPAEPAAREDAPTAVLPAQGPTPEDTLATPEDEPAGPAHTARPRPDLLTTGAVAVQLGAYLTNVRASRVVERAAEAGFESRVVKVPGSPLFRVRVGAWTERGEAEAVAEAAEAAGFRPRIVGGLDREKPVN